MSYRVFQVQTFSPTATADNTNLADGTYMAIANSSTTYAFNVKEIMITGQAAASAVNLMTFARNSTPAVTPTALSAPNTDGPLDNRNMPIANPVVTFVAATTPPKRSNLTTSARLSLGLNAFGGIVRWHAAPGEEWSATGTSSAESSLSAYTGGSVGSIGAHILYEPV